MLLAVSQNDQLYTAMLHAITWPFPVTHCLPTKGSKPTKYTSIVNTINNNTLNNSWAVPSSTCIMLPPPPPLVLLLRAAAFCKTPACCTPKEVGAAAPGAVTEGWFCSC
eukprot:GHRR01015158.1.p3 GENE.GHRR01015158.1~~GHRR01015158.1.p3  ORF type:complete len:109 (-),score=29.41 GHRR01015158.1:442-768(-)